MNVAIKNSPFQREVREWQRVDPNTGALVSGRLQADRWNNGAANKYGKVIDSQNISTPNGTRLQQRKEMEILQARTVSGSIHVVRSSTVQKSSSRTTMNTSNALRSSPIFAIEEVQSTLGNSHILPRGSSPIVTSPGGSPILGYERGRSASTEDLASSIGPDHLSDDDEDPRQWRRVSTIRRSLQYPKATAPRYNSRPTDLPLNMVSVSKIKRDLESNSPSSPYANRKLDFEDAPRESHTQLTDNESSDMKQSVKKATLITTDSLAGIRDRLKRLSDESLYKEDMVVTPETPDTSMVTTLQSRQTAPLTQKSDPKPKLRDTNPAEWYLRRKSYGFEEMPVQQQKSMSRMETSTDSGLGRSGEISSVWPQHSSPPAEPTAKPRGTIVTLSGILDDPNSQSSSRVLINTSSPKPYYRSVVFRNSPSSSSIDPKRHSIAVDESKYVRDSKTLVNLNGVNSEWNTHSSNVLDETSKRSRRVEFCKTEVHFAAESGRVNIVETDGKPPSTNNFRRRRRSSTSFGDASAGAAGTVLMHFGDPSVRKAENGTDYGSSAEQNQVRVTVVEQTSASASNGDTAKEDEELVDEISLRGILKNKPVKPKPYHLGENLESTPERLWGVRLKPITGAEDLDTNKEISLGYQDRPIEQTDRERVTIEAQRNTGYAARVNLHQFSKAGIRPNHDDLNQSLHHHNQHHSDSTSAAINPIPDNPSTPLNHSAKSMQSITTKDSLKSTSLIMQTIKSNIAPNDEPVLSLQSDLFKAIKSTASEDINRGSESMVMAATTFATSTTRCSSLAKTSSTSSVQSDGSIYQISNLVSNSSSSSSMSNHVQQDVQAIQLPVSAVNGKPIAAPRIKKIGSTSVTAGLSHQLSQLRRIYEAAELDSLENELVDNEVQLYLGGGNNKLGSIETGVNVEAASTELSGSWSRVRTQTSEKEQKTDWSKVSEPPTSLNLSYEPRNSNRLSIMLHSPTESTKSFEHHTTPKPIAKPRTTVLQSSPRFSPQTASTQYQTESHAPRPQARPELKPSNGARKLREHELSYFGLNVATSVAQSHNDSTTVSNRSVVDNKANRSFARITNEGKLISDKPDLLLHAQHSQGSSPRSFVHQPTARVDSEFSQPEAPLYENIQPTTGKRHAEYDRSSDRQRDEQNLRELKDSAIEMSSTINKTADESSRRSRSRSSQPFDTIREEGTPVVPAKTMLSKGVQVSRGYNHTLHRIKPLNRTSSASSTESITSVGRSRRSSAEQLSSSRTRSHRVHSSDEGDSLQRTVRTSRSSSKTTPQRTEKTFRSSTKRPSESKDVKKTRETSATGHYNSPTAVATKERVKTSASASESPRIHRKPHHVVGVREANMPLVTSATTASTQKKTSKSSCHRSSRDRPRQ